jgi:hypothetical protein
MYIIFVPNLFSLKNMTFLQKNNTIFNRPDDKMTTALIQYLTDLFLNLIYLFFYVLLPKNYEL